MTTPSRSITPVIPGSTSPPETKSGASAPSTRAFSRTPSSWDPQDDLLLRHLKEQQKLGWKEIAAHFSHRTPNACQFRWRRLRSGVLKNSNPGTSHQTTQPSGISKKQSSNGVNITGALAGLNALSSGVRTASPAPVTHYSDDKFLSFNNANNTSLFSSIINPSNASPASSQAPQVAARSRSSNPSFNTYSQWSFNSSTNPNPSAASPDNDPLSNSISSLTSLDSSTSNKNSFNLYNQETNSSSLPHGTSFSQQSFSQGFMLSYSEDWRPDEDELLLSKRRRELSLTELSILLPTRSEEDIIARIKELDQHPHHRSSLLRSGSAATSIYGEETDSQNIPTNNTANVVSTNTNTAPVHARDRMNSTNGYGLHTLSRTLSASSQISLNSNTSSFSYLNAHGATNSSNTITTSANPTSEQPKQITMANESTTSSPLPSSKSSPLISSRQLHIDSSGASTPSATYNTTTTAIPTAIGGGTSISSSLRRTLSQTSKSGDIAKSASSTSSANGNASSANSINTLNAQDAPPIIASAASSTNTAVDANAEGNGSSPDSIVTDSDDKMI